MSSSSRKLDTLRVKFTNYNTVRERKPYTIYEIELRGTTQTWIIYKRYSAFYKLHQDLVQLLKRSPPQSSGPIQLPTLPPRRLTRSMADEFVEKRKRELEEYVRHVLLTPIVGQSDVVFQFLEVPENVRPMIRGQDTQERDSGVSSKAMPKGYQYKSHEEKRVLEVLHTLNQSQNKVSALKEFETYFFEWRPRLSSDIVQLLLRGEGRDKGLLDVCGDFDYSYVACRAALSLLCRLLDIERNKDAQLFIDCFTSLPPEIVKKMQLHRHIIVSKYGTRLGAFKLIAVLLNRPRAPKLDEFVTDDWARGAYIQWAERKNESNSLLTTEPQEEQLRPINLAELGSGGHKKTAADACQEVIDIAHDEVGWKVVKAMDQAGLVNPSSIKVTYKINNRHNVVVVRVAARMPFAVDRVTKFLLDFSRRGEWDSNFHWGNRLDKLDVTADVVQYVYKSFSSPYKYRDLVLMRSWDKLDGGGRILVERSVVHPLATEQKDHVRAVLAPSGYIVTPLEDGCLLTWVAQMDRESVLIVSPDLLGESTQLADSIDRIRDLIAQT